MFDKFTDIQVRYEIICDCSLTGIKAKAKRQIPISENTVRHYIFTVVQGSIGQNSKFEDI